MSKRTQGWLIAALLVLAMVMGTGPGVLLVNRPALLFGLPRLYVWALVWYAVQVVCVVWAARALWTVEGEEA